MAFLGIMVFPNVEGTIDTRMARIAQIFTSNKDHTLVPLVLVDIYRALTLCKSGAQFFEGSNVVDRTSLPSPQVHELWFEQEQLYQEL